jgi:hypothetical protein
MAVGYIALGTLAFVLAVNYFAVLPGEASTWDHSFRPFGWPRKLNPSSPPLAAATAVALERGA